MGAHRPGDGQPRVLRHPGAGPSRTDGWASTGGGYFDYFGGNGGRARPKNASYYSFNVLLPQGGHWHVVVLNSACGDFNNPPRWVTPSCALTGAMANWLRADLAADTARCELAIFHEPAFATPAPWGQEGDADPVVDDGGPRRRPGCQRPQPRL